MPIYDCPTKSLMGDWVNERKLTPEQTKSPTPQTGLQSYPKIKRKTVEMHGRSFWEVG